MTIHDDLREVMGLLGKATPGDWRYAHVEAPKSWAYVEAGYQQGVDICTGSNWSRRQHAEGKGLPGVDDDFKAITAAVNFLRQHGPALLAAAKYEEANPLGGPATMLEAAARRIRAGEDFHEVLADYGLLARQDGEDADAVLAAMNDGYTVRKALPAPYLTDEANAEFAWIIERAAPPFCDKRGGGMWHASTPREAIAKARAAIDAARSGGGG